MKIDRIEVINFRCIDRCVVELDDITCLIGPNGVGKSTVLGALDWFFNGAGKSPITDKDVYSGAEQPRISVRVDFSRLSAVERERLGPKYAPEGTDTFTAWRVWEDGAEKITGKAKAFPGFEQVRAGENATRQRETLARVREENPELNIPQWTNQTATMAALDAWERENPELLEDSEVSATNFFGFAGQGVLSGLFDFALVSADLRAGEESADSKNSILGRILEKSVDRQAAQEAYNALSAELTAKQAEINAQHISPQLATLSQRITREVEAFSPGRQVFVMPDEQKLMPQSPKFNTVIKDHLTETEVVRQGHGFQRALLIAALKLLAHSQRASEDETTLFLAIEEPELFQHPTQCKAFAQVLRKLALDGGSGIQVAYATHSPYFIEPQYFHQIRRISRKIAAQENHATISVTHATVDAVCARLDTFIDRRNVERQLPNACLGSLSEAVFAQAVVLTEGDTDSAIIEGISARNGGVPLSVCGVAVANGGAKNGIMLNYAILESLGIPLYVVFDGDKGCGARMANQGRSAQDIRSAEENNILQNKRLLRFLGEAEMDWPSIDPTVNLCVFEDRLEENLQNDWNDWELKRQEIVANGHGFNGKNSGTYLLAALQAESDPPEIFGNLVNKIRELT